jgi:alkylation response protein AidB-like acyl-CoA dehydrogenase
LTLDHQVIANEVESRFGKFLREEIAPTAVMRDQEYRGFSVELLRKMGRLGLIGFTAPKIVGGGNRTWEEWGHALEEIAYLGDDSGLCMLLSYRETANNLVVHSAMRGREHLLERYAKPAVRGEAYIGWLFTEEKDALSFDTKAVRRGDRYILNGRKPASTGGTTCTAWMVYASIEDGKDTAVFMVERDDPGVVVKPIRSLGMRSMGLADVSFENVELTADRIIAPADGLSHSQIFVNERRVTGSAWLTGRMRALIEKVIEDTRPKVRFSRPLIEFDTFKAGIGRMRIALERARAIAYRVFERTEERRAGQEYVHDPLVSISKYVATESAIEVADIAQRLTGGHGYFEQYGIERYIRDFYALVPIIGGQVAIETQIGERELYRSETRTRTLD